MRGTILVEHCNPLSLGYLRQPTAGAGLVEQFIVEQSVRALLASLVIVFRAREF